MPLKPFTMRTAGSSLEMPPTAAQKYIFTSHTVGLPPPFSLSPAREPGVDLGLGSRGRRGRGVGVPGLACPPPFPPSRARAVTPSTLQRHFGCGPVFYRVEIFPFFPRKQSDFSSRSEVFRRVYTIVDVLVSTVLIFQSLSGQKPSGKNQIKFEGAIIKSLCVYASRQL